MLGCTAHDTDKDPLSSHSGYADVSGRPLFPGERQMPLQLPNGRMGIANYAGPGTQVIKRLQHGDPARMPVDKIAEPHDVDFTLSANAPTVAGRPGASDPDGRLAHGAEAEPDPAPGPRH